MQDIQDHKLGETNELLTLDSADEHRAVALSMAQQAVRSLFIFSHDLDHAVFDTAEFEAAASQLARGGQHARIQILVQNTDRAVRDGHRLVRLAQRISSKVEIRKPIPEYADTTRSFLVADEAGYISRQMVERYTGVANFNDRLSARDLVSFFDEVWQRSQQDIQLRRLHI